MKPARHLVMTLDPNSSGLEQLVPNIKSIMQSLSMHASSSCLAPTNALEFGLKSDDDVKDVKEFGVFLDFSFDLGSA
jgi:hypothetical protein